MRDVPFAEASSPAGSMRPELMPNPHVWRLRKSRRQAGRCIPQICMFRDLPSRRSPAGGHAAVRGPESRMPRTLWGRVIAPMRFPTGRSGTSKIGTAPGVMTARDRCRSSPARSARSASTTKRSRRSVNAEMQTFLNWLESDEVLDSVLKAGLAHVWFVTIHPFDDGNGRMARGTADLALVSSGIAPPSARRTHRGAGRRSVRSREGRTESMKEKGRPQRKLT